MDKERAIAENELASKIELARREERLIAQEGENAQRRGSDEAAALRIATEAAASKHQVLAGAEAEAITAMEGARVGAERDRLDALRRGDLRGPACASSSEGGPRAHGWASDGERHRAGAAAPPAGETGDLRDSTSAGRP